MAVDAGVDLLFCAGPLMKFLWDALPSDSPGGATPRQRSSLRRKSCGPCGRATW